MHASSYAKAEAFLATYGAELDFSGPPLRVLEVGSKSYHAQDTYRDLFASGRFDYVGLDIEAGANVDIVPSNPFVWDELSDASFDLCVSGQTFEHNPYFWATFAEMARVLRPGGFAFVVAPGAGHVHRYPVDCWRFYPDSWAALATLMGMELVESYFETDDLAQRVEGGQWRDSVCIARKPALDGAALERFHTRLRRIVAPFADEIVPIAKAPPPGRFAVAYESEMARRAPETLSTRLRRLRFGGAGKLYR
ncbi:MAG TPA: methyltransferase domain-containing protein [Rhizobiales bacterium]|nr:methyltransferase domain-containing protein [Hyphomicrobiales bacterium]